ncbi:O-antigen polysaccharide polymerase Wzy [Bacillus mycoides]|uniref:O-antigen polysaccharide polymerase Wzy n=1 Tax=Bacillus mycoides TaxID=1405 RepID=UPI003D25E3E5
MKKYVWPFSIILILVVGILSSLINYNLIIWFIVVASMLTPAVLVIKDFRREDFFLRPTFWFFGSLLLWSITLPIDFMLGTEDRISYEALYRTCQLYAVANLSATTSFVLVKKIFNFKGIDYKGYFLEHKNLKSGIVFTFLGMLMLIYKISSNGGLATIGIENRLVSMQNVQADSISFPWQAALSVGLINLAISIRKKTYVYLMLLTSLALFLIFGFGARGDVLFVCLPAYLISLYKLGFFRRKKNKILAVVVILMVLSPIFTISRNVIIYNKSISEFEKWEWAYNTGETGGAFRVTSDIVNSNLIINWPDNIYSMEILSFLPSKVYESLYGHKKFSSDKFFVQNYYPLRAKNGASFGFSPVAESWLAGGIIGVLCLFFLSGILLNVMSKYSVILYLLPTFMWFQRVSFDNFINSFFFICVFYLITVFINIITKRVVK